jgi:SAM-dependent methyltransferase
LGGTLAPVAQHYILHEVTACNMCAAPVRNANVLGRRLSGRQGLRPTRRVGWATTVMRCGKCGLVFANPQPTPQDVNQHYDRAPEDYWVPDDLGERGPDYFQYEIDTFHRLWERDGRPVALDVGAGLGRSMARLTACGFESHGLEPSAAFRQAAIERGGIDAARLTLGTIETATYEAGKFDFVTFGAVLEHLSDPAGQLDRVLAWLAPGGIVHVEVPSARWLTSRLVNLAYRLQGLDYVTNLSPMHVPFHLYEFTAESFRQYARRSHCTVMHGRLIAGRDTFLPGPDPLWRWLMDRTGTGMQLEVWLRLSAQGHRQDPTRGSRPGRLTQT